MSDDDFPFSELVSARVSELGGKVSAIEKRFDLKPDAIRNVMRTPKGAGPTLSRAKEICEALGLEFYIGRPRDLAATADEQSTGKVKPDLLDDFAFVERFDVSLSAGHGENGDNARPLAPVSFRRDWLSERGLVAEKCVVCSVRGTSMEPLLFDGDLVLLDRRRSDLRSGQVYGVVDVEGDVRIKRIEQVENGLLLRSENSEWPTELRHGEDANRVHVIGSLVWSGHNHDMSGRKASR
ncbi:S24 family peptidase [Sulfitobacter pseudonitzschiae]|uniref:S24 family peptidase n=1 Tax=Pseudosulfitobacter pseudonitzschiae TaxID=1402135 RepID=A0A9Q2P5W7_9RHOB|nr:S24 family peptidase [Pseudosulfitobacter pseudonitzschiae]MBM2295043.1 S24 family peptidase [Pseudosulfitobacter pseudonitzschiae]MBM2299957.1 S24 family peptidase [Pseudosulfitobacter pseudonitzschiae]MBM2304881.1 S24 family peptidase [Pseudosulfitobacter pseudonitzschiae]MBM2314654.1 S24 family peptidase [Pseudosulfitobacter pseudonitzschiae]MBM2319564.1 S24 family peptidase [Pseudosulfitobacter pseudonitzschiae]